jgi:predicted nucleic acid-binding protein
MTGTVLADTGPLYALADPSDHYHQRALSETEALLARSFRVAVSYPVLCEGHNLVLQRLGGAYSRQWLAELLDGSVMLNPEPTDYLSAASLLDRFPDQRITLTDAFTATLSRRLGLPVWTFDRHFTTLGSKHSRPAR